MSVSNDILLLIQKSIDDFNGKVPKIQKAVYVDLVNNLKKLETREGNIVSSLTNLKLIGTIRNRLQGIILSSEYVDQVATFTQAFDQVTDLQNKYFAQYVTKFKPLKTLAVVKDLAVDSALNYLTDAGINANVIEPIHEVLRVNITTGGSYDALLDTLKTQIQGSGEDLGIIEKHTKQITTDSINQYNAVYNKETSNDLGFVWFRYIGSNLTTTREFCEFLTKKDYVHISELPGIIKGLIDGHQCKIYPKTKLPYGMVPKTSKDNFIVYRGGYNCGHQFYGIPDAAVPAELREKFEKKQEPAPQPSPQPSPEPKPEPVKPAVKKKAPPAKKPEPAPTPEKEKGITQADVEFFDLDNLKKMPGIENIDRRVFQKLKQKTTLTYAKKEGSHYAPYNGNIHIQDGERMKTENYPSKVFYHEVGHAIHFQRKIITFDEVAVEWRMVMNGAKRSVAGKVQELDSTLAKLSSAMFYGTENPADYGYKTEKEAREDIGVVNDILGSLTGGRYGGGHKPSYYKKDNKADMEVFAHGNHNFFQDNRMMKKFMPEIYKILSEYFTEFYKTAN